MIAYDPDMWRFGNIFKELYIANAKYFFESDMPYRLDDAKERDAAFAVLHWAIMVFGNDVEAAYRWLDSDCAFLWGASPIEYIRQRLSEELLECIGRLSQEMPQEERSLTLREADLAGTFNWQNG